MDYDGDFFQLLSLSGSVTWTISEKLTALMGLSWGGSVFQDEFSNRATDTDLFNPDETYFSAGFSYLF